MSVGGAGRGVILVGCVWLSFAAVAQERGETASPAPNPGASQVEISLTLGISTRSTGLDGVALGLIGTWVDQEARGLQGALIGNITGGELQGGQLALVSNLAGGAVTGVQFAGLYNGARSNVTGAQLSAGGNVVLGAVHGLQLGGLANWAGAPSWGLQAASAVNIARAGWRGIQLGLVNIGGDVNGAQIGVVNIAGRARGLQFGLVNVSDQNDDAPIGLVSAVRKGQLHPELFGSDLQPVNLGLKFGGRRVYSTLFAGTGKARTFVYGYGMGVHLGPEPWWVDLDVAGSTLHSYEDPIRFSNVLGQLRMVAGVQLGSRLAIFAGPTANGLWTFKGEPPGRVSYLPYVRAFRGQTVQVWPGVEVGLRL